jgi:3-hydroxymyristoyl/3-hydroxydecanoyl-(acyl carrier protein) dehydratase
LNILLKRNIRGIGMYRCEALVDGEVVADAEMMCSAQDRQQ